MYLLIRCPKCRRFSKEDKKVCKCGYKYNGNKNYYFRYKAEEKWKIKKCKSSWKDLAEKEMFEFYKKFINDSLSNTKKIAFDTFCKKIYLPYCNARNRPNTIKAKKHCIENRLIPLFKDTNLGKIEAEILEKYISNETKIKRATINLFITIAKNIFNKAVEWGYITKNPIEKVKLFSLNNQRVRYLNEEELKKYLKYASRYTHFYKAVIIALNTGMRKEEILSLKWSQVDLENNTITLFDTKNGKTRYVPINKSLSSHLIGWKNDMEEYVITYSGRRIHQIAINHATTCKLAGITDFKFHDLRHSFASYLTMRGVDLNTIRDLLGHKSMAMTLRYSHLSEKTKYQAVNKLHIGE